MAQFNEAGERTDPQPESKAVAPPPPGVAAQFDEVTGERTNPDAPHKPAHESKPEPAKGKTEAQKGGK